MVKATFLQLLNRILPQALAFITQIILARTASIIVLGQFALLNSIMGLSFAILATGIQMNFLRSGEADQFGTAFNAELFAWTVTVPLCLFFLKEDISILAAIAVFGGFFMMKVSDLMNCYYRLSEEDWKGLLPKTVPHLIFLSSILILQVTDFATVANTYFLSGLFVLAFLVSDRKLLLIIRNMTGALSYVKGSLLIAGTTVFTQLNSNVDLLMIGHFIGMEETGLYKIALSFSAIVMPAIGTLVFMYLSQVKPLVNNKDFNALKLKLKKQVTINLRIGVAFLGGVSALLPYIVPLLYGAEAKKAVLPAIIISVGMVLNILMMVFSYTLLALDEDRQVFWGIVVGSIINLIFNYIFIPRMGMLGGAAVSTVTQLVILIWMFHFARRSLWKHENVILKPSFLQS